MVSIATNIVCNDYVCGDIAKLHCHSTDCSVRVYCQLPQLLTAAPTVRGNDKSLLTTAAHGDEVQIHQLKAVAMVSSSGVCESVVSGYH